MDRDTQLQNLASEVRRLRWTMTALIVLVALLNLDQAQSIAGMSLGVLIVSIVPIGFCGMHWLLEWLWPTKD